MSVDVRHYTLEMLGRDAAAAAVRSQPTQLKGRSPAEPLRMRARTDGTVQFYTVFTACALWDVLDLPLT